MARWHQDIGVCGFTAYTETTSPKLNPIDRDICSIRWNLDTHTEA